MNYKKLFILAIMTSLFLFLIILDGGLNQLAVKENGNKMPVQLDYRTDYSTSTHYFYRYSSEVNFYILTDIIHIGNYVYSIGDFLIFRGFLGHIIFQNLILIQIWREKYFLKKNSKKKYLNKRNY